MKYLTFTIETFVLRRMWHIHILLRIVFYMNDAAFELCECLRGILVMK